MRAVIVAALAMMVAPAPADACSISPDLRIEPTFVEKVAETYAIHEARHH